MCWLMNMKRMLNLQYMHTAQQRQHEELGGAAAIGSAPHLPILWQRLTAEAAPELYLMTAPPVYSKTPSKVQNPRGGGLVAHRRRGRCGWGSCWRLDWRRAGGRAGGRARRWARWWDGGGLGGGLGGGDGGGLGGGAAAGAAVGLGGRSSSPRAGCSLLSTPTPLLSRPAARSWVAVVLGGPAAAVTAMLLSDNTPQLGVRIATSSEVKSRHSGPPIAAALPSGSRMVLLASGTCGQQRARVSVSGLHPSCGVLGPAEAGTSQADCTPTVQRMDQERLRVVMLKYAAGAHPKEVALALCGVGPRAAGRKRRHRQGGAAREVAVRRHTRGQLAAAALQQTGFGGGEGERQPRGPPCRLRCDADRLSDTQAYCSHTKTYGKARTPCTSSHMAR